MEIQNIIVTKSMTALTANAYYRLETSVSNGLLNRVSANVLTPASAGGQEEYLGSIYYENHALSCSFLSMEGVSAYFADFENFVTEIRKEMATGQEKTEGK
ncbi:hypothetical protein [Bacteroides ovatus]|jgi:hypothetical protein|uniref:hypothetical protein n=1 Tax=Bacteroides ovatus TaxID=28116 RepID=UPI0020636D12|nr:hypothetical protein [Bacteroides ovatus]UYI64266.1 MAG: hypothetical protein OGM04_02295 [Bacteroides ovatus]DAU81477.1 MAG TPA: hypothetical protein [Caudoviricetes sp.]